MPGVLRVFGRKLAPCFLESAECYSPFATCLLSRRSRIDPVHIPYVLRNPKTCNVESEKDMQVFNGERRSNVFDSGNSRCRVLSCFELWACMPSPLLTFLARSPPPLQPPFLQAPTSALWCAMTVC